MATLYLRNVPADLDALLTREAAERGSSKNRRAIEALRRGLGMDQVERSALIEEIRRERHPVQTDIAAVIRAERPSDDV